MLLSKKIWNIEWWLVYTVTHLRNVAGKIATVFYIADVVVPSEYEMIHV